MKRVSILAVAVFALIGGAAVRGNEEVRYHTPFRITQEEARFAYASDNGDRAEFRIRNRDWNYKARLAREFERGPNECDLRASRAKEDVRGQDHLSLARDRDDRRVGWDNLESERLAIRSRNDIRSPAREVMRA